MGPQISGLANLWHAERFPWHTSFTAVPIFFYIFARPAWLLWRICVYIYIHTHTHTHISDCVHTQCELLLLPNKTAVKHFDTNREQCKVLTGYLSLGCWTGGVWVNTRHWKKKTRTALPVPFKVTNWRDNVSTMYDKRRYTACVSYGSRRRLRHTWYELVPLWRHVLLWCTPIRTKL